MRRAGRGNWILISLICLVLAIIGIVALAGESPSNVGNRFMRALARADVDTLVDLSYFNPPLSKDEIRKEWTKTLDISKYYRFVYQIKGNVRPTPDRATVSMMVMRNVERGMAYEENFSLDMVQVDGKWKVDVRSISREMYPALPR
ncbi:MAG: hypothetical protein JSS66_12600 [Armatimonadetes bacterium]|nr:hypothetical protein [Armatimonadota bacterium]